MANRIPPPPREFNWARMLRTLSFWALLIVGTIALVQLASSRRREEAEITISQFTEELNAGNIASVEIAEKKVRGAFQRPVVVKRQTVERFTLMLATEPDNAWVQSLLAKGVDVRAREPGQSFGVVLLTFLPYLLIFGLVIFMLRQMQQGGNRAFAFGKSKAKLLAGDTPKVTFADVAGCDEAKQELEEIIDFLKDPQKFQRLGGRLPKGALLVGPPGTGKTLLAKAVAGEAGRPFFSMSGSDFVEMFVGVGASRVRDLFEQGKAHAPCIIFIDEIDAVGRHRGAGLGGGHDEREQTLNQLLVEMDGFEMKDNIILIAATNRPNILDVHTRGKPLAREIDVDALAGQTPGFTGADLSNLVNEAALLAARNGKREITQVELEEGIMRVIAGPEKKTRVMSEKERLITAYHEMGHAIVGHYLEHSDPVHKISIISRGQALGYTISMPQEDRFLTTKAELTDNMAMTLGGRAAEEIVFGEITTGASNDLEKVTATAKQMVMRFGMSEKLGPRVFGHDHGQPFLGREFSAEPDYSDEIAREIDDEIRRIVEAAHQRATDLLTEHRDELGTISEILVKRETIEKEEFQALLAGKTEEEIVGTETPPPPGPPVP